MEKVQTTKIMGDLNTNLGLAGSAIEYTRNALSIGRGNSVEDNIEGSAFMGTPFLCVTVQRTATMVSSAIHDGQTIAQLADRAERFRCGNCGEQSAVAMRYLIRQHIRPLDYMSLSNGDHTFVVIDRLANSNEQDPRTWGASAVVCDPWIRHAYSAAELLIRMRHISHGNTPRPYSRFRT